MNADLFFLALWVIAVPLLILTRTLHPRAVVGPDRRSERLTTLLLFAGVFAAISGYLMAAQLAIAPHPPHPGATTASQPTTSPRDPRQEALVAVLGPLGGLMFVLLIDGPLNPGALATLGLLPPRRMARALPLGIIALFIAMPIVETVGVGSEWIYQSLRYVHPREHQLLEDYSRVPAWTYRALIVLAAVVLAPMFEEIFFRGHLQTLLLRGFARILGSPGTAARFSAIFVTSIVFALLHPLWSAPMIFALSFCLGYVYERTGNLWANITLHALFNATEITLFLLASP